jgi:Family of unknown function (DUF6152)
MRRKGLALFFLAIGLLPLSRPMLAHHGSSAYDLTKEVTLTGKVSDFAFIQPHPIISLDVKDGSTMVKWSIEMTSPNHLVRYGWNGHKLKPGDEVMVTGNVAKNGLKVLNLRKIAWATGEEIPLGPPPDPSN